MVENKKQRSSRTSKQKGAGNVVNTEGTHKTSKKKRTDRPGSKGTSQKPKDDSKVLLGSEKDPDGGYEEKAAGKSDFDGVLDHSCNGQKRER